MKNTKKLSAMALTGLLGFSLLGSPVMAANDTTNVSYTPGATTVDKDGKILMVVPKDVTFTQGNLSADRKLTIKSANQSQKLPTGFSVEVKVSSNNEGKLKDTTSAATEEISYTMKQGENQDNATADVMLKKAPQLVHTFTNGQTPDANSLERHIKFETTDNQLASIEKKYGSEISFTDTLTFTVDNLTGEGLVKK